MKQGDIFQCDPGQAIHLPKTVALPEDVKRVEIVAIGRVRIITPVGDVWDSWFDGSGVSADFMIKRGQVTAQERDAL